MEETWKVLVSGAFAGLVVDASLYPIDTIKSRLQTQEGFAKSGGFKKLYKGVIPVVICSVPNAAIYFTAYERAKRSQLFNNQIFNQILGGASAEIASCCFKIPFEVVKINSQTGAATELQVIKHIFKTNGSAGFFRGFWSTVAREVPFSMIQMPIWEQLKTAHKNKLGKPVNAAQSAFYGAIGGALAGFFTNPLDVIKTRIMLRSQKQTMLQTFSKIYKERGIRGLFAGSIPRVTWIGIGGAVFFGAYEQCMIFLGRSSQ